MPNSWAETSMQRHVAAESAPAARSTPRSNVLWRPPRGHGVTADAFVSSDLRDELVTNEQLVLFMTPVESRVDRNMKLFVFYLFTVHRCRWQLYENDFLLMSFNVLWLWGCLQFSALMFFLRCRFKYWSFYTRTNENLQGAAKISAFQVLLHKLLTDGRSYLIQEVMLQLEQPKLRPLPTVTPVKPAELRTCWY